MTTRHRVNVVVVAPHPDDEAIGCGGALCAHAERGDRVLPVFLTSGEQDPGLKHLPRESVWEIREPEAFRAAATLGAAAPTFLRGPDWFVGDHVSEMAERLRPILVREAPSLVYVPHPEEWHPDHRAALAVVQAALRGTDFPPPVLRGYEVWTPLATYDDVEDITSVMRRKLNAIGCYRSQLGALRYDRAVRGLNQYRGIMAARCRYAEVYRTLEPRGETGSHA
jgi:LmbE family N-acetylglucosaminyl deacetylase